MDNHHWPKIAMEEGLTQRRKTWMKQNKKWNIKLHKYPSTNEEMEKFVMENFKTPM